MDYLQYVGLGGEYTAEERVLNLVINGLPSILTNTILQQRLTA